ncbi:MAG: fatty acid transporter [Comamonadaceae bacterium]|nr:MAG: fatty acid transporter [Comamonadaceae bacterium]
MRMNALTRNVLSTITLGLGVTSVHAAGFQLLEQNASGLGNAYAGSAAVAENASTIFFNPAGMSYLPGVNLSTGVAAVKPSFKFSDNGNSRNPLAMGGGRPRGGNGGDAGGWEFVPNAYGSLQLNDRWHVGIGIGAPFGLSTHYDDDWAGQYHSRKFKIQTININPSVSYKVNDMLALGAGVNWQRIDAEYTKQQVVGVGMARAAKVEMDGDAWGWNLGAMLQPTPDTRVGLSYRSKMKHSASGTTKVQNLAKFDARADVDLPDSAILSVMHSLTPRWDLLADVSWTGWSSIPELKIRNSGPGAQGDTLNLKFRDTWRFAVGANYKVSEQWKLKFGVAYDQSPVHNDKNRPTSLPDNNRVWLSTGVQYQATKNTTLDVGYTYLHVRKTKIDNDGESLATKGRIAGDYSSKGNIIGVQLTSRF